MNKKIFNEINILRIKHLNEKFKQEEKRIYQFSHKLEDSLNKQIKEKEIDDFSIVQSISLYSNNTNCNKRHHVKDGDPFWVDNSFNMFYYNKDDLFYSENWNELVPEHPFGGIDFCYSMHCICFHSILNWQDLLDIDEVRIVLSLSYQFNWNL